MRLIGIPSTITLRDHSSNFDHNGDPIQDPSTSEQCTDGGTTASRLPSRELLRLHAALAGVLHGSGAAETFSQLLGRYTDLYGVPLETPAAGDEQAEVPEETPSERPSTRHRSARSVAAI